MTTEIPNCPYCGAGRMQIEAETDHASCRCGFRVTGEVMVASRSKQQRARYLREHGECIAPPENRARKATWWAVALAAALAASIASHTCDLVRHRAEMRSCVERAP